MSVRLRFVREAGIASSAIAWYSAAPFSHVGALTADGCELGARSDRVGGKPAGVQIRPPGYAKFATQVVFTVPATPVQEGAFYDFLHKQIGKPYDHSDILGFVTGRNWRQEDAWICSELVSRAGEMSSIMPFVYLAANKITPGAAALAFSAIGATWEQL